eukprot:322643-Rhodomonas_salina.4
MPPKSRNLLEFSRKPKCTVASIPRRWTPESWSLKRRSFTPPLPSLDRDLLSVRVWCQCSSVIVEARGRRLLSVWMQQQS